MFEHHLREALKLSERLGTWVLYEAREARSRDLFLGFLLYRVDDLRRMRGRAKGDEAKRLSELLGHWRRAARWIASLDSERWRDLVEAIVDRVEANPRFAEMPYVVARSGHPSLRVGDKPPRRVGRPRTTLNVHETPFPKCEDCGRVTL